MPPAAFSPLGRAHVLLRTLRLPKWLRPSLREDLYGVYSSLFEKLRKNSGGGTSRDICCPADRLPENSPTHTSSVDEESRGREC